MQENQILTSQGMIEVAPLIEEYGQFHLKLGPKVAKYCSFGNEVRMVLKDWFSIPEDETEAIVDEIHHIVA